MKPFNPVVETFKESIFSIITQMAQDRGAINLAQGFPDFDGPDWALDLARAALGKGKNQYAPSYGILPLREAISQNYQSFHSVAYDPKAEVLVTNGATEAIYTTITALVNPGDEVVVFEPVYDSYVASLQLAHAVIKTVTLKAPTFHFELADLRAQVGPKTKLLILNNPHNPTGRVFTVAELTAIGQLAIEFDFLILSDEVYEYLTFERRHTAIASLPGLRERVITISSIGKTLSLTGWKIGWACAPNQILKAIHNMHQFVSFSVAHPLQVAVGDALKMMNSYVPQLQRDYKARRELLVSGLKQLGFEVYVPEGTYFAIAKVPQGREDVEYAKELITKNNVATIPTSIFYLQSDEGKKLIRFCFAKKDETLRQALAYMGKRP